MPNFNVAAITRKGLALNTKVNAGQGKIQFTRAAGGAGTYPAGYDLTNQTGLKDERQSFDFVQRRIEDFQTVILRVEISNKDLKEGYPLNEFGIFANDPDEGEILYSIATAADGQADVLPAFTDHNLVLMTVDSYVSVSSTDRVQVVIPEEERRGCVIVIPKGQDIPLEERKERFLYLKELGSADVEQNNQIRVSSNLGVEVLGDNVDVTGQKFAPFMGVKILNNL